MPTKASKPWDERRNDLLGDVIQLTYELSEGKVPHVHSDITFVYVHFFDEDGTDIGNLTLGTALHALWNDVFNWSESSTEEDEHGEPAGDLNIKDAVRVELQTH